ncbi:Nonribosomal peptide synthetase [Pedobacter cryoconitis]|uniref:Nonribosomal peptide synthetase n=1 Tax=Pedobacter cryoconitis TaxID=188932 RepID=A0A127VET2_9SPHI|nr:non-ribosomal peptide synthetase [Pedobacter cryoconitis]AMP99731.1 Nonribosomal peptide synthetase [Pedobacter cryoconitis]
MLEDVYPLSPLQEGLYYHWLQNPGSPNYFAQISFTITGNLDIGVLRESYHGLVSRHAIARTFFTQNFGENLLQVVRKDTVSDFEHIVLSKGKTSAETYRIQDREKGFNLHKGSQMRLTILEFENNTYEFIWSHHHILMDGWCLSILIREFFEIYYHLLVGRKADLKKIIPYSTYIKWLAKVDKALSLSYWQNYLDNYQQLSSIPSAFQLKKVDEPVSRQHTFYIEGAQREFIRDFCSGQSITENTFFQSLWAVLLSKYNNVNDIVFGTVVSGRPAELEGVEDMIGLFINTIPVRVQTDNETTFRTLVKEFQRNFLRGTDHHYVQLADINSNSALGQNLFDHILVFENYPVQKMDGVSVESAENVNSDHISLSSVETFDQTNYNFWITIASRDTIKITIGYNNHVYDQATAELVQSHMENLLSSIIKNDTSLLRNLDYLSTSEKLALLEDFNATSVAYPKEQTLVDLFAEQVLEHPEKTAVVFEGRHLSYGELDQESNRLAAYLRSVYQIVPGELIGVRLDRSEWLIISLLGVLKSGGAYVPIDPGYPEERIEFMISDSGCKVLLDRAELDHFCSVSSAYSDSVQPLEHSPSDLMYVLYTSGSTGKPKGCMLEHGGVLNRLWWMWNHYGFSQDDIILQKTTFSFDVSVWELFLPLCWGARMVMCSAEDSGSPEQLSDLIFRESVTALHFVPSMLNLFIETIFEEEASLERLSGLRLVFTSGEALPLSSVHHWYNKLDVPLHNLYGPTEASIDVTYYPTSPIDERIPIGKPISNTQIFILDRQDQLCGIGIAGEICLGGVGLARGYLNQAALTAEKFVTNPYRLGERMYRTGDLGRWLADGNVEYIGRMDEQVKIRGYRIELGEIDNALQGHAAISGAVVLAPLNNLGERELKAYITGEGDVDPLVLKSYLGQLLPSYMVPQAYVQLDVIPLTMSGKADRKALQGYGGKELGLVSVHVAPRTETERQLVEIWSEVLGRDPDQIGISSNFFELGGHSLKVIRLISHISKTFEVKLNLNDPFEYPTLEQLASLINTSAKTAFIRITPVAPAKSYVLSSSQRRLWILSKFKGGNTAYNISGSYVFEGNINIDALRYALNSLIERHESLRTVFREDDKSEVRQFILDSAELNFNMTYIDSVFKQENDITEETRQQLLTPFDLDKGPLIAAALHKVKGQKWIFSYVIHHIISDDWSMGIIIKELLMIYNSYVNGQTNPLKPLRIQYKDYAAWQEIQLSGKNLDLHRAYWLDQFDGKIPVLEFVADKPRPVIKSYKGGVIGRKIRLDLISNFKNILQKQDTTLFMGLLSVVNVLLNKFTNQQDIIIGTSMVSRDHADLESQIGFFVNTIALRTRFSNDDSYLTLLSKVKDVTLGAYQHQIYPFDELVNDLSLERDTSRHPLFDVMVVLQNVEKKFNQNEEGLNGLSVSGLEQSEEVNSKFDFTFFFSDNDNELNLNVVYNSQIYHKSTIEQLFLHFEQLLEAIVKKPSVPISQLDYLDASTKRYLLNEVNQSFANYPQSTNIIELFEQQVLKTPDKIAVIFENITLTYSELNDHANKLANYLLTNHAIKTNDIIGIMLDRSEKIIISILGILKSGAAYLPIDPDYPVGRKKYMLEDSGLNLLITQADYIFELDYYAHHIFAIDVQLDELELVTDNLAVKIAKDNLAYIIYTSGSTGQPKGVTIRHLSLIDYYYGITETTNIKSCEKFGLLSTVAADLGNTIIYTSLLFGGTLQVFSASDAMSYEKIASAELDCIKIVPTHWKALQDDNRLLIPNKCLILGGEQFSRDIIDHIRLHGGKCEVYNHYGPTETTIGKLIKKIDLDILYDKVPLGRPFGNTSVFLLDDKNKLVPFGVIGEIAIGGYGLSAGYLNKPDLTRNTFIDHPFFEGEKLYKTGDFGRWNSEEDLVYEGRKDNQIKIRGYRIELGEIEYALQRYPNIADAVVVDQLNKDGERELIAYVVGNEVVDVQVVRDYLNKNVPAYMIPQNIIQLEELPLMSNGKLDRNALPEINTSGRISDTIYQAPKSETEIRLVSLWSEVLGVDESEIGVKANFFDLGGHSLRTTRLASQIYKRFGAKLDFYDLFTTIVLEDQAILIDNSKKMDYLEIPKAVSCNAYVLSSSQRRIWILSQFEDGNLAYNVPGAYVFDEELNIDVLQYAFTCLIDRHEILRTVFMENEQGELMQFIMTGEDLGFTVNIVDLRSFKENDNRLREMVENDFSLPFNLVKGPLLRATLYQVEDKKWVLSYVTHHIISDGWSMGVLMRELLNFYGSQLNGTPALLPELRIQYKDYAVWQQQQLIAETLSAQKEYWLTQFSGELPVLNLSGDRPRPIFKTYKGGTIKAAIDTGLTSAFKLLLQNEDSTLFMGLLAVVNGLLNRYSGQEDIIVGSPIAGRYHADLEGQIGFYVNTLALRVRSKGTASYLELLKMVKQVTLGAYVNQMFPFDTLVNELQIERDMSRHPLFDVMIVLQGQEFAQRQGNVGHTGLKVSSYDGKKNIVSKFDLLFAFVESDGNLVVNLEYNSDIFNHEKADQLLRHFEQLLHCIVRHPLLAINQLDYLDETEKKRLFNLGGVIPAYKNDLSVLDLFNEQVKRTPDRFVISYENKQLTYRQLDELSDNGAAYLYSKYNISADDLIGISLDRTEKMIIAMLSVLKSGGAYVPFDSSYPVERIKYMQADSQCKIVLDEKEYKDLILYTSSDTIKPVIKINNTSLAYVLYTSGSTGKPKGVMVEHAALFNTIQAHLSILELKPVDKVLQFFASSFDASIYEIFTTITSGACLFIINDTDKKDPHLLEEFLQKNEISFASLPPVYFKILKLDAIRTLKKVLTGGEQVDLQSVRAYTDQGTYFNAYGPTEICVAATIFKLNQGKDPGDYLIPIGKPISGAHVYIVDKDMRLLPEGVTGEIVIGGAGLARGYMNNILLTTEKFLQSPFNSNERVYKTGDLGKWQTNGNLVFSGRIDSQVKINGHRIELSEIENVLVNYNGIKAAVVLEQINTTGRHELIAYIVSEQEQKISNLREYLKNILPNYMIPSHFMQLDSLPLMPNGKVNRNSISKMKGQLLDSEKEYIAPRSLAEAELATIWEQILNKEMISVNDNYFELGGDSMVAVKMMSVINRKMNIGLKIKDLFSNPSIQEMAIFITGTNATDKKSLSYINLEIESQLDVSFQKISELKRYSEVPKQVLVTGATGFVGAYLLKELLDHTKTIIYCLVRGENAGKAKSRVIEKLKYYNIYKSHYESRIIAVPGNLSKPNLGLSVADYENLSDNLDYIYHTAAYMDLISSYQQLKPSNVGGNIEIVRLAVTKKLKKVVYTSTLSIFSSSDGKMNYEADPIDHEEHSSVSGYAGSKWVGEKIMLKSMAAGLPVQIHRLGLISGDKITGKMPKEQWFPKLLKSCYEMGVYPREYTVPITPVDFVSKSILNLSLQTDLKTNIFHLTNVRNIFLKEFLHNADEVSKELVEIDGENWLMKLYELSEHSPLPITPLIDFSATKSSADDGPDIKYAVRINSYSTEHTLKILEGIDITFPEERHYTAKYLKNLI